MTKPYFYIPLSLLLFYLLMYFQLDYKLVFITAAAAMIVLFIFLFLIGRSFLRDQSAEAEQILKDAKAEAEKIMKDAESNIKFQEDNLQRYRAALDAKEQELLKNAEAINQKVEDWKRLLAQHEIKLNYYGNFISSLRRIIDNKKKDDTSKVQNIKRRLYSFEG
ncbi:MAG: Ribonuclease Y [Elusimicrobia bacterium ADurb.Bin231]|nr:MAG: Ribonuclease Y [Elusimicrobia bacterium ADurb.Bin231]